MTSLKRIQVYLKTSEYSEKKRIFATHFSY